VLVVGGGPAGMYAAFTAAERGHDVTLFEKDDKLGGLLWFTDVDEHKESLRRFRDCLAERCGAVGVVVRLNTEATRASVNAFKPDAVICAVGSHANVPPIKGIGFAAHALDVYAIPGALGKRVVMIGGGLIGCETGLWLAERGQDVHILEMRKGLALEADDSHRRALLPLMEKKGIRSSLGVVVTEIDRGGVHYNEESGVDRYSEADNVVYAVGQRADAETTGALRDCDCEYFVAVGDCAGARQVKHATYEGFCAAMDIL
jgi:pyruvate/2-oxoglutarate dehydrogenase complex dihydrolipoamide dehydrogenase (E3) component